MPLSYLCDDYHKQPVIRIRESRQFESMYILQGITRPTRHTLPTLSPRMVQDHTYLMWSTYSNPSRDANRFRWIPLLPRKRGSRHNPQHTGWPIRGSVPNFSSEPTNEAGGRKPSSCRWPTTRLTGPISPICDRYVQYLLVGANPSVLNRHRWGLHPWRCWLAIYHSPTFPTSYLHFPPRGLARSPV
jgi:hypothetical protein